MLNITHILSLTWMDKRILESFSDITGFFCKFRWNWALITESFFNIKKDECV